MGLTTQASFRIRTWSVPHLMPVPEEINTQNIAKFLEQFMSRWIELETSFFSFFKRTLQKSKCCPSMKCQLSPRVETSRGGDG